VTPNCCINALARSSVSALILSNTTRPSYSSSSLSTTGLIVVQAGHQSVKNSYATFEPCGDDAGGMATAGPLCSDPVQATSPALK